MCTNDFFWWTLPSNRYYHDLLVKSVSKMIYDLQAAFDSAFFFTDGQNSTEKPNFTKSTSFSAKSWKSKNWKDYKKRSRLLKVVLSKANNMMENKLFPTINKWERMPFRGSGALKTLKKLPREHHWWKWISL